MGNISAWRRPNPVFSREYKAIVGVLIDARKRAGLSQRSLAGRIEKSFSHVARIEAGQRRVDVLELYRVARALGEEPHDLFGRIAAGLGALESQQASLEDPTAP